MLPTKKDTILLNTENKKHPVAIFQKKINIGINMSFSGLLSDIVLYNTGDLHPPTHTPKDSQTIIDFLIPNHLPASLN